MPTRDKQFAKRIQRLEDKFFPYLTENGISYEELLELMWLTNPDAFREEAEKKNCPHHREIMERPPRRDRDQFVEWGKALFARLNQRSGEGAN